MILSGKIVTRAIRIVSIAIVVISFCFTDFHDSSSEGLLDMLFDLLLIVFPAAPLLVLSIKVFEQLPKTTAVLAAIETIILLDLFYEIHFGKDGSSTSAVAVFFIPLYLLIFNFVAAFIALIVIAQRK